MLAKHYIKKQGYIIRRVSRKPLVAPRPKDREMRGYFDEALRDGASFVFYQYPVGKRSAK